MIVLFGLSCQPTPPDPEPEQPKITENMVHIQSEDYDFWIDRYEYPNRKGEHATAKLSFYDAKKLCETEGKRLCTADEWRFGCSQGGQTQFVYGDRYRSSACNSNQMNKFGHTSLMQQQTLHATSGAYFNCKTETGIHDMNGNLEEWVLDDWRGNPGALMGGAWYTYWSYADCSGGYSHQPDFRMPMDTKTESAGTRCCWSEEEVNLERLRQKNHAALQERQQRSISVVYDPQNEIEWKEGHWIDRYEYPNRSGEYPLVGLNWQEARSRCQSHGKDLCSVSSWEQACSGPEGHAYPYGSQYQTRYCQDSSREDLKPSGSMSGCQSSSAVFDMTGSVWEWTRSDLTIPELQDSPDQQLKEIRGGSWFSDPMKAQCRPSIGYPVTGADLRFPDLGFRCCREEDNDIQAAQAIPSSVRCPVGMIAVDTFCIDRFEYPNQQNQIPLSEINLQDAQAHCADAGKTLCTDQQWLLACQGHEKRRWSYGSEYELDRCYHSSGRQGGGAIPSGQKERCTTPEGVQDLTGNLWEWTASGTLRGGNWNFSEGMGQCQAKAEPAKETRSVEYGFRCCLQPALSSE